MDKSILIEVCTLNNRTLIEQHEEKISKLMNVVNQSHFRIEALIAYLGVMFNNFEEEFALINREIDKKRKADYEQLKAEAMEAANSE